MPRDFAKIRAWELSDELCVQIYRETENFPKNELYGLVSQIRRAAVSVPSNIAEGAERQYAKEYLHFLYLAKGSLAEVRYQLHLSRRLGYLTVAQYERLDSLRGETASTLHGLIKAVEKDSGVLTRLLAFLTSTVALHCVSKLMANGPIS